MISVRAELANRRRSVKPIGSPSDRDAGIDGMVSPDPPFDRLEGATRAVVDPGVSFCSGTQATTLAGDTVLPPGPSAVPRAPGGSLRADPAAREGRHRPGLGGPGLRTPA